MTLFKSLRFAFTVCLVAFSASSLPAATIRIQSRASVGTPVIHLKDVAHIHETDDALRERIGKIVLGPTPPAGSVSRVNFSDIRLQLQNAGVDLSQIRFAGRTSVIVSRSNTAPSKSNISTTSGFNRVTDQRYVRAQELLSAAIERSLSRQMTSTERFLIEVRLAAADVDGVLAARSSSFTFRGFGQSLGEPHRLQVGFTDVRGKTRTIPVDCLIRRRPFVLVAKFTINRGKLIQAGDLTWKQVSEVGDGFTNPDMVVGQEAKRSIRRGAVLERDDIRRVPLVRSNDIVTVYSRRPGIVIKREMKARSAGALGETVTLVGLKSRELISGRVIGLHKVEVRSSAPEFRNRNRDDGIVFQKSETKKTGDASAINRRLLRTSFDRRHSARPPLDGRSSKPAESGTQDLFRR